MNTIEKAKKLGNTKIMSLIADAGLTEYGVYPEKVTEKISAKVPGKIIAALNNSDTDHVLLSAVKEHAEEMLCGMAVLGQLSGTSSLEVTLPEGETELGEILLSCAKNLDAELSVVYGIVDVRRTKADQKYHFMTCEWISDVVNGCYRPGVRLIVRTIRQNEFSDQDKGFVRFGTLLGDLIPEGVKIKAFQIGERLYPEQDRNMPLTPELMYGSGVVRLFTDDTCMVAGMEAWLMEKRLQGCGRCTFCREGLNQIWTRIHEMTTGHGDAQSPEICREIAEAMPFSTKCSMGQTGSETFLDSLKLFGSEYEDHMKHHRCRSGQCLVFLNMFVNPYQCVGCGKCRQVCPEDCIEGRAGYITMIETMRCTRCGKCMEACPQGAIIRTTKHPEKTPDRLTRVGRYSKYYE